MKKVLIVDVPEDAELHKTSIRCFYPTSKERTTGLCPFKEVPISTEDEIRERYLKQYHDDLSRAVISADVEIQVWRGIKGE